MDVRELLMAIAESVAMQSVTLSLNRLQAAGSAVGPGPRGMLREVRVGLLLGAAAGVVVGLVGIAWLHLLAVAGVVAGVIMAAGAIGAGLGFFVPRLVRRWKLNPTVASGPVTLAITDIGTLACYFGLAAAVLG
jgi:magnesium transporter